MTDNPLQTAAVLNELNELHAKIQALLPPQYQACYQDVKPVSMGSAELKLGSDGRVAWDEIWTSFCDLALAGGPPHRGTLLEPVSAEEVEAEPAKYQQVVEEIGRGLWMVTGFPVLPRIAPGWVGVRCRSAEMAAWLVRAIVVENVSTYCKQDFLYLPAGPHFRLAKEIKNVATVLAKTCHHYSFHMSASERAAASAAGQLSALAEPALPSEIQAAPEAYKAIVDRITHGIEQASGFHTAPSAYAGWVGVACADESQAIWLMRAMIVENILARREETTLYLPASPRFDAQGQVDRIVGEFARSCRLWWAKTALEQGGAACRE